MAFRERKSKGKTLEIKGPRVRGLKVSREGKDA